MIGVWSPLAATALLGSAAIADNLDKLRKDHLPCSYHELSAPPTLDLKSPCGSRDDDSQTTVPAADAVELQCASCGLMPQWDDRLRVWLPYRN
jgi:hypothetical protein